MPHKITTVGLLDEAAIAVQAAGSCIAILRRPDDSLYGEVFDGIGFARGAERKGFNFSYADCPIIGTGGVGSAIAAATAAENPGSIGLFVIDAGAACRPPTPVFCWPGGWLARHRHIRRATGDCSNFVLRRV